MQGWRDGDQAGGHKSWPVLVMSISIAKGGEAVVQSTTILDLNTPMRSNAGSSKLPLGSQTSV